MKRSFTEKTWRNDPEFRTLCEALLVCRTPEDIANFLRDIATLSEMKAWSERLTVAMNLLKGLPYRQVADLTGASTTTVSRVALFLRSGEGGYRSILPKITHHHTSSPARRGRRGSK